MGVGPRGHSPHFHSRRALQNFPMAFDHELRASHHPTLGLMELYPSAQLNPIHYSPEFSTSLSTSL
jgi:hypothetical protein